MTRFVVLLRAVNVGGTGKISMPVLKSMGEAAGLQDARTYIASGNMIGDCDKSEAQLKTALEDQLLVHFGKPVAVLVRTATELAEVSAKNPFPSAPANFTVAIFLDAPPPATALEEVSGQGDEELAIGKREIYVHYGSGMGRSKLKIPAAKSGTARNMNTIAKLAALARE